MSQVGWFLGENASGEETRNAAAAAAYFDSDLRTVSHWVNAFDVQMAGARSVMCSGFVVRSFYQFFTQLPGFIVPRTDGMDTGVPGTIMMASQKEVKGGRAAPATRVLQAVE